MPSVGGASWKPTLSRGEGGRQAARPHDTSRQGRRHLICKCNSRRRQTEGEEEPTGREREFRTEQSDSGAGRGRKESRAEVRRETPT